MILIAEPTAGKHRNSGCDVGWGSQTLGCSDTEAHVVKKNQRQEVSNGVSNSPQTTSIQVSLSSSPSQVFPGLTKIKH
jgi:hypothetical protein